MKKKIFNILLSICVLATMIIPVNIRAVEPQVQVTFAWNCDGSICASAFHLTRFNAGTNYFINRMEAATLIDGGGVFNAAAASSYGKQNYRTQYYIFREVVIEEIKTKQTWEALDEAVHEGEGKFDVNYNNSIHHIESIDPCGGNDGPKSVVHNGDRDFRLIVYDNGYVPITFNVDPDNYTYYLGNWDPVFSNPVYDVSGTTEAKPMDYTTYLLEDRLSFSSDEITSVKALNVPDKAVTVQKVDNMYRITFNSNYYSKVTFELTNRNGKKHYLRINRVFVQFADNNEAVMWEEETTRKAYASFIYPANKDYKDYDVIATITNDKGSTTKILTATAVKVIDGEAPERQDGRPTFMNQTVFPAGFNLKKVNYLLDIDKNTESVMITVTKKDATKGTTYGGTFGGNGEGVELDISMFKRMLNDARV